MTDVATELWAVQGKLAQGPGSLLQIMNKLIAKVVVHQDQAAPVNGDFSGASLAELTEEVTVVAQFQLACSQTVRQLWDRILAEFRQDRGEEYQASLYLETLENMMRTLSLSCETLGTLKRLGHPLPIASRIDAELATLREFSLEVARNWVGFTQRNIDAAREELAKGECQDLDDAFAEIAGISVEQWHEKVRRRKEAKGA